MFDLSDVIAKDGSPSRRVRLLGGEACEETEARESPATAAINRCLPRVRLMVKKPDEFGSSRSTP